MTLIFHCTVRISAALTMDIVWSTTASSLSLASVQLISGQFCEWIFPTAVSPLQLTVGKSVKHLQRKASYSAWVAGRLVWSHVDSLLVPCVGLAYS